MQASVLVLNIDFTPLEVISWRQAIEKLFTGKVEVVEEYDELVVRSPSIEVKLPAVVRLMTGFARRKVRLSRKHILARDAYTCQYCNARPRRPSGKPDLQHLTIDHVVPRAQSRHGWVVLPWSGERVRVTSWENVVTACDQCNFGKADRTPKEASLPLRKKPRAPSTIDIVWMSLIEHDIPMEWQDYLPENSPWRNYWDAELDPS